MNLKFYLRGLGLGFIVASIILGILHYRSAERALSDADIKARAAELGMVEGSSYLTDNEAVDAESLLESIDEAPVYDDPGSSQNTSNASGETAETEDNSPDAGATENETTEEETASAEEAPATEEAPVEAAPADEDGAAEAPVDETAAANQATLDETVAPSEASDNSETATAQATSGGTIQIVSGDSSDRVARKLQEAGIVPSAAEYDSFLCANGYDRYIRTGTYTIPEGSTNEAIARLITGR